MITILIPMYIGNMIPIVNVNEWNIGKNTMPLSLGVTLIVFCPEIAFEKMFLWVSIAPFGLPVVPEV